MVAADLERENGSAVSAQLQRPTNPAEGGLLTPNMAMAAFRP